MNRTEKQEQVSQLREQFDRASLSVVAGYEGLSVAQVTGLRNELRKVDGGFRVVKNTLAKRAVDGQANAPLGEHFKGAVGVVFAWGDPAAAAKVVKEFAKEAEAFSVAAGMLDGELLDAGKVNQIASLPSREELMAKLAGSLNSPVSGLVNCLSGPVRGLVVALGQVAEQKGAEA